MFLGIGRRSHLFRQERTKTSTIRIIDSDILSPVGHVVGALLCHSTSHAGHKPRAAVPSFILGRDFILGGEGVVRFNGVFDIVASRQGLDSQDVIQVEAFVT